MAWVFVLAFQGEELPLPRSNKSIRDHKGSNCLYLLTLCNNKQAYILTDLYLFLRKLGVFVDEVLLKASHLYILLGLCLLYFLVLAARRNTRLFQKKMPFLSFDLQLKFGHQLSVQQYEFRTPLIFVF